MVRIQVPWAALAAAWLATTGCGLFDFQYEEAEIGDVVKGIVPSSSDRYRVRLPAIPIVRRDIGIVREGGLFVPIVAPDLRGALARCRDRNAEIGVHFVREPRRHLVLERVWTDADEIVVLKPDYNFRYHLPDLVDASDLDFGRFDSEVALDGVAPDDRAGLAAAEGHAILATAFQVRKAEVPEPLGDTELFAATRLPRERPQYFLTSRGSDYLVTTRDPMTRLMLDYLVAEKREFRGGIVVEGIFDPDARLATRVAGTARIEWIGLGGPLYYRAPAGKAGPVPSARNRTQEPPA